jgi:hypothetical protein
MTRRGKRDEKDKKKRSGGKKDMMQQLELVEGLVEQVRTIDSEVDLLKQKINLVIREINVLKRVVLSEKKEIKELQVEEQEDKSRFESIINIVKGMKGEEEE